MCIIPPPLPPFLFTNILLLVPWPRPPTPPYSKAFIDNHGDRNLHSAQGARNGIRQVSTRHTFWKLNSGAHILAIANPQISISKGDREPRGIYALFSSHSGPPQPQPLPLPPPPPTTNATRPASRKIAIYPVCIERYRTGYHQP